MATLRLPDPVLLVVAAFSRYPGALDWARERLIESFGALALTSADYPFDQTAYYAATMGTDLMKRFFVFADLMAPEELAQVKLRTNELEKVLAQQRTYPEARPVNLDPGILNLGKFMLATTKDQAHRIYLQDGIFAEVTLRFQAGAFEPWPWTYADYRQPSVLAFLREARAYYKQRLRESRG